MKHPLMGWLIGSLLVFSCSVALAGQAMTLTQGASEKLSGYSANGVINARSAFSADQADPNAISDVRSDSPSVDDTQSDAISESPVPQAVWVTLQGTVRNDNGNLVCAMALANGQYMFTCNPLGAYGLTVPLDNNGQIDLQVFAAGHMPFRQKLPSNQAYYGVILKVAEDCNPQTPATSLITIDLIDNCPDGLNIDYKYYDTINGIVWPSSTSHWVTSGYGHTSSHTLECQNSGNVCLGARSGSIYWGVDVDGSESCTSCCMPCENTTWTRTLVCN